MKSQLPLGQHSIKLLIAIISWMALISGCHVMHRPNSSKVEFSPLSNSNTNHSLINGSLAIDSNDHTFIYSFVDGLILNNSKKIYKDSLLIAWQGETYYQLKPLYYDEINLDFFDNIDVAFNNFLFYYGEKNGDYIKYALITIHRDTSAFSYKQHKTLQFVFFNQSDLLLSVTSFSDLQDTIFKYNKNGQLTKVFIRDSKGKKFKKATNSMKKEELKKYHRSNYWHEILNSFNTDFSLPILESNINTLLSN